MNYRLFVAQKAPGLSMIHSFLEILFLLEFLFLLLQEGLILVGVLLLELLHLLLLDVGWNELVTGELHGE